jgi:DNA primase
MRSLASEDARDQIRLRLNLVDVVQQHVRLRKNGREHVGLCPFHQEKTPSFSVNEQKQSWYCFGCQKGGDVFAFIEQIEKTDFPGALRILAEMAGVELPERSRGDQERAQLRRRLIELNRLAARYYEHVLLEMPAGEPGRDLLGRREVGVEIARRFGLGYAPGGTNFASFLRKRGHSLADAQKAGLVRRDGSDFFQRRVVVPIRDERGQPVAFTGRAVLADQPPKYMNSPETEAYTKGRVLFALDLARTEIEARGHAVLVEGQFDVFVAHQFGVANAVASSGTSLTPEQLTLLKRFTDEIVLWFDNDQAGRRAEEKAIRLARERQLRTRVARIPGEAKDPDEFLRGGGTWEDLLRDARPGWEVMIRDRIAGLNSHQPADRELGVRRIREVLDLIADPAEKDTYAEVAGRAFDIDPKLLLAYRAPARTSPSAGAGAPPPVTGGGEAGLVAATAGNKLSKRVGYLLQVLAVRPQALERVRRALDPADLEEDDRAAYARLVKALDTGATEGLERELGEFPLEEQNLIRRAWAAPPPGAATDEAIDDVLRLIRQESRDRQRRAIRRSIEEAERRKDRARAVALQAQLNELSERI